MHNPDSKQTRHSTATHGFAKTNVGTTLTSRSQSPRLAEKPPVDGLRNTKPSLHQLATRSTTSARLQQLQVHANQGAVQKMAEVVQRKNAVWTIDVGIKASDGGVTKARAEIEYDTETGISVSRVQEALRQQFGENHAVKLVYMGSNTERNANLANRNWVISHDLIKFGKGKYLAVLEVMESKQKAVESESRLEARPSHIVTLSRLREIIREYGFNTVVTANHIHGAGEPGMDLLDGVKQQQQAQINGVTLFIDPLFEAPGRQSQYYDLLCRQGGSSELKNGVWLVKSKDKSIVIGVLPKSVYTDELEEIGGITLKNYINQKRPVNVVKE